MSDSTPDRMNSPIRASKCEPPGGLQRVHGHVNATARRADDHLQVVTCATCARSVHAAHGMAPAGHGHRGPPLPRLHTSSCTSCPHYCCCYCHAPPAWALQSARRVVAPMLSHWISKVKVTTILLKLKFLEPTYSSTIHYILR